MLDQLLSGSKSSIVSALSSQLGISAEQANGFIAKVVPMVEGLFKSGNLDVSKILAGDFSSLTSKLDISSLSQLVGGDAAKAKAGVNTVATGVVDALKQSGGSGGLDQLLGQLGGAAGGKDGGGLAGGLADAVGGIGKLFGKG
jgi:Bacterial protein of unknown function (DUF937)